MVKVSNISYRENPLYIEVAATDHFRAPLNIPEAPKSQVWMNLGVLGLGTQTPLTSPFNQSSTSLLLIFLFFLLCLLFQVSFD